MRLKSIELSGFKSFAKRTPLAFATAITSIVGPNGSGKSNIAESFRFVLGEQSMKSMRGKRGEDMIWNGSAAVPRAGRASVKLVFDNPSVGGKRLLNVDFDEVTIERVVNRDGGNEYVLNGSQVRLRDITELLASANIGASGHHIISQGEADRVLTCSPKERREMIEDALGLTAFLYKKVEALKKLEKTAENMREVEGLRRELAPHLRYLGAQVKKIEESQKLRDSLAEMYLEYLKRESVRIRVGQLLLAEERRIPQEEYATLGTRIAALRAALAQKQHDAGASELVHLEDEGRRLAARRDSLGRELGRVEGELAAQARIVTTMVDSVPATQAREFAQTVEAELAQALSHDEATMRHALQALIVLAKDFLRRMVKVEQPRISADELNQKKHSLETELAAVEQKAKEVSDAVVALRAKIDSEKDANREGERELFAAMARRSELETVIAELRARAETLSRAQEQFRLELGEAAALVGRAIADYDSYEVRSESGEPLSDADIVDEPQERQDERRRKLERLKIKVEESGAANAAEVLREHKETVEREQFLARELADLEQSATSLNQLIAELTATLEERFASGIATVAAEFDRFFKLVFGGGSATLSLIQSARDDADDDTDDATSASEFSPKYRASDADDSLRGGVVQDATARVNAHKNDGVEVDISLPHKRVKGLHMLSGGERALTSIALIFAMSQVNPPPFLILDETDAALDEANSRRYGDMIEVLAQRSQLIVITHNRETMSRAGVLYGVTMGSDGISKLLSIKFEDALAVAK